jgi:DNA-3-methyladenine glycosylase II
MTQYSTSRLNTAHRHLKKCEYLGAVIKKHGKSQYDPTASDPFDTLISSIISQQLSVKAAGTIDGRVRSLVGKKYRPAAILKHSHQALRDCGLSNRKVEYIQGIAKAVSTRKLSFGRLQKSSDEEIMSKLIEIRGVGQWTAEMFMIFSLGRMDIFSSLDVGLQRGMRILFDEPDMDLATMEIKAERWQPYRSIASLYLWKLVD